MIPRPWRGVGDHRIHAGHRLGDAAASPLVVREQRHLPRHPALLAQVAPAAVQNAGRVGHHDVVRVDAGGDDEAGAGDPGRARAEDGDARGLERLSDDAERVDEAGERHRRGPLLVVVPHRDAHDLAQLVKEVEAFGVLDVLEVDAAEARLELLHGPDQAADVLRAEADRHRIDPAEELVDEGLAFHHRHRPLRADVAEPEHPAPVGDDRDRVAAPGELIAQLGVRGDGEARLGDAGRVPVGEVLDVADGGLWPDLDLAGVELVEPDRLAGRRLGPLEQLLARRVVEHLGPDAVGHRRRELARPRAAAQVVRHGRALGDHVTRPRVSTADAASVSPRWRSISAPDRISAVGFALFWPAYFGAEPWTGLEDGRRVADVRPRRDAEAADEPGGEVADDVAVQVRQHEHVVQLRLLDELHAHVVDDPVLELDPARVVDRDLAGSSRRKRPSESFMMFALWTAVTLRRPFRTAYSNA